MRDRLAVGILALLVGCGGGGPADGSTPASTTGEGPATDGRASVWAVDLVRTAPGRQADYLRSIEANWASARGLARDEGAVRSYRALATEPDTLRAWDVLLLTEYADRPAYDGREVLFERIFASDAFASVRTAAPEGDVRTFFDEAVLHTVVDALPGR